MRRRKSGKSIVVSVVFIALLGAIIYLAQSPYFERKAPQIESNDVVYWNRTDPLKILLSDNVGIKYYSAKLSDDEQVVSTISRSLDEKSDEVLLEIEYPKLGFNYNKNRFSLEIEVVDSSFWNFMSGNRTTKTVQIIVDNVRPTVSVLANSYAINKGGSALVVFRAFDENLVDLYIETNYDKKFDVIPFYKEGYYIALLAWPVDQKTFSAQIVASDIAGNVTNRRIPYYLTNRKYRVSNIKVSDSFIDNQITDLARQYPQFDHIDGGIELFQAVNETLREQNVDIINKATEITDFSMIEQWSIEPFHPLRNGAVMAGFGDHRIYSYNGENISESYHLGIDYASTRNAPIVLSNPGIVKYARFNGLYGNMPVIDHGLGLFSLYAHCSSIYVQEGQHVTTGDKIGETGVTGLAFGDHLHFGMAINGVEVRPEEWMDRNWIKLNIDDVINKAKEMIDIQER